MSPVTYVGPRCRRCRQRAVWDDGLCSPCWRLVSAFGHDATDSAVSLDPAGAALDIPEAGTIAFERALTVWLEHG